MKNVRTALTNAMISAWSDVIHRHYNTTIYASPDINSEAALQAYFFHELKRKIADGEAAEIMPKNTRVFIEPALTHQNQSITPDLLVCRNATVIAFVELKYLPRMVYDRKEHLGFNKDRNSLLHLYKSGGEYVHDRYRGAFKAADGEKFTFSENTLLVWGGVYSAEEQFRVSEIAELSDDHPVLELIAITNHESHANVSAYFAGKLQQPKC